LVEVEIPAITLKEDLIKYFSIPPLY